MTISAGLLMYRKRDKTYQVLLAHPGGPYYVNKDDGVWTLPKGQAEETEKDLLEVAKREFEEETGFHPEGKYTSLGSVMRKDRKKQVFAWAFEGDCDPTEIKSNTFSMEWPPKSGKQIKAPEIDRADFFTIEVAKRKIIPYEIGLLEAFEKAFSTSS
jgi:predicted NUDIX family NTP pyrophosphohydrolase